MHRTKIYWNEPAETGHPFIAEMYDNIAVMYGDQGDYTKATEFLGNALDIKIKTLGHKHPMTVKANLA